MTFGFMKIYLQSPLQSLSFFFLDMTCDFMDCHAFFCYHFMVLTTLIFFDYDKSLHFGKRIKLCHTFSQINSSKKNIFSQKSFGQIGFNRNNVAYTWHIGFQPNPKKIIFFLYCFEIGLFYVWGFYRKGFDWNPFYRNPFY